MMVWSWMDNRVSGFMIFPITFTDSPTYNNCVPYLDRQHTTLDFLLRQTTYNIGSIGFKGWKDFTKSCWKTGRAGSEWGRKT